MTMRRYIITLIVSLAIVPGDCAPSAAQDGDDHQEVLDRIFADWEKRRAAMDAVEYHLEGTKLIRKGEFTEDMIDIGALPPDTTDEVPPEDLYIDQGRRYVFDFANNRFRAERRGQKFHGDRMLWRPDVEIHLYDGEHVQMLAPREENTSPEIAPPEYQPELEYLENLKFVLSFDMRPLFLAHGLPPAFNRSTTQFQDFTLAIQRDIYRWHAVAVIDGRECTVLRTINNPRASGEQFCELWVDLERDSAVPRYVSYANRNVSQLDVAFQHTPHGWFPEHFTWTGTRRNGELWVRQEFTVTGIIADPPLSDDLFHAEPKPGMVVADRAKDERYVYGGPGKENISARDHYVQSLRDAQQPRFTRWMALALIGAVAAVGIAIVVHRRRTAG